jgi:membrane-associated phospholipid phosphatase
MAVQRAARAGPVLVRLLLSAALLLGLMLGAGLLVSRVEPGTAVEQVDVSTDQWLADHRTPTLDAASGPAADLGTTGVVIAVGAVGAAVAGTLARRWRPVLVLVAALTGELVIFLATTLAIDRPRPPVSHLDAQLPPTSSFPSGHTAASICLYGGIAALVMSASRSWWRWLVLAVAVALVVVVAAARLYRGAHFPTDVLGSVVFAVPWLLVVLRLIPAGPGPGRLRGRGRAPLPGAVRAPSG